MPGAGDTSINDFSFSERPVLVLTHIGDCGDLIVVPEDGDPLSVARHDTSTLLGNLLDSANRDVSVGPGASCQVPPPLHNSTRDVQRRYGNQSYAQHHG